MEDIAVHNELEALIHIANILEEIREGVSKKHMAFDTTALVTALAEGRVDETEARQLLTEAQELEVKIAKLLTPKSDTQQVVEETQPNEVAPEVAPEAPAEEATEQPAEEAKAEAHAHMFVEGNTNCTVCGLDIAALQAVAPTGEVVQ